jgi:RND family efflux transporter MFP subunit
VPRTPPDADNPVPLPDLQVPLRRRLRPDEPAVANMKNSHPALCAVALALLAGCGGKADTAAPAAGASAAAPGAAAASAPPVSVTTVRAQQRDLAVELATTGTVTPLASVEVRPQLTSLVTGVHIREGQFVRSGDLLFTLDARTDEARVAQARAQLARDEAALADARRQLARNRELLAQNFVSQGAVDTTLAQVESKTALLAADRAAVDAARVALSYARITAPGAGRAGAIAVYPGSAVQANQTTLVTITQLDPIAVAFSLPQVRLADALAALADRGAAVLATLPEGGGAVSGRLQFVDNAIDAATGTVKVKAVFGNKDGRLWPGAYVNVAMTARTLRAAVIVPQAAIIQSARGALVYVVQDGRAAPRPVQILYAQGEDAAVGGVRPGERIALDGRQNLRPGSAVIERARDGANPAAGAASGAPRRQPAP